MQKKNDWVDDFPILNTIDTATRNRLVTAALPVTLPEGVMVFLEGAECSNYLLVLQGSVRIQKLSESGREIVLYRVESGQSCVLTTSCLLASENYNAEAITETPVEAIAIPNGIFQELLASSPEFRSFVFSTYSERLTGLLMLIDAIAFGRMDARLAAVLTELADRDGAITKTHQELARELGTAREVVSRLLKEFERRSWLNLGRGRILICDSEALQQLADNVFV
ncbi:MAG: Crp/Fnr family transcriptional regulator [Gammaproteobacteria bacterium]|jgi:CRP/FNR family transcriptional regulator, anaerobic regulatory protein